ncbi:MAG: hypothetical protein AB2L14_15430 [Candidatus Xenobiia bacterium LiM19]
MMTFQGKSPRKAFHLKGDPGIYEKSTAAGYEQLRCVMYEASPVR